ncbi:phage integrase family domain-containing protein [Phthorimaea operculella]|nr:phage integrase family domain-containing protein [Phthorimaea operculella]
MYGYILYLPTTNYTTNIRRLLKGAYKLKPNRPKYTSTWDPQVVFNYISKWYPNLELNLEKITKKLVILLALSTAHRVQTLSLLKLENVSITQNGVKIAVTDIIKTIIYIFVTKNMRTTNAGNLLLTHKAPHRPATAQTISRWIKQVLSESGVDVGTFSAHSTRHAASATSAAFSAGINVETIRKTAGWTSASTAFARFYNRPINDESSFARAVAFPNQ